MADEDLLSTNPFISNNTNISNTDASNQNRQLGQRTQKSFIPPRSLTPQSPGIADIVYGDASFDGFSNNGGPGTARNRGPTQGMLTQLQKQSSEYRRPMKEPNKQQLEQLIWRESESMRHERLALKREIDKEMQTKEDRKSKIRSVPKPKDERNVSIKIRKRGDKSTEIVPRVPHINQPARGSLKEGFTSPGPILFSVEDPLFTNKFVPTEILKEDVDEEVKQRFRAYMEEKKEQETRQSRVAESDDLLSTNEYVGPTDIAPYNQQTVESEKQFIGATSEEIIQAAGRYYKERRTVVNIDSQDRNVSNFPRISRFDIELEKIYNNVKSIRLISTEFPNSDQVIRSFPDVQENNNIYWENWDDNQLRIVKFTGGLIPTEVELVVLEDPTEFLKIGDQVLLTNVSLFEQQQTVVDIVPPNVNNGVHDNTTPYDTTGTRFGWMVVVDNPDNYSLFSRALSSRLFGPLSDLNIAEKSYNEIKRPMYVTQITPGNYIIDTIGKEIPRAMNEITRVFDGQLHNFAVDMDRDTDVVTFTQFDFITAPDALETTEGSEIIIVHLEDHNLLSNDCITILNATSVGGIPAGTINNRIYEVSSFGPDSGSPILGIPVEVYDNTQFRITVPVVATSSVLAGGGPLMVIGICHKFKLYFDFQDKQICLDVDRNTTPFDRIGFLEENSHYPLWRDIVLSSNPNPASVLNKVPGTIESREHDLVNSNLIRVGANTGTIIPPPRGLRRICNVTPDTFTILNYVVVDPAGGPDPPLLEYYKPSKDPIATNAGNIVNISVTGNVPPFICIITTEENHRLIGEHQVGLSETAIFGPVIDPLNRPFPFTHDIKVKLSNTEFVDKNTCQKSNIDDVYTLSTDDIIDDFNFRITLKDPNLIERPSGVIGRWATNKINFRIFSAYDYKSESVTVFTHYLHPGNRLQIYRSKQSGGVHEKFINTNHKDTMLKFHVVIGVSSPFEVPALGIQGQNTEVQILLESFPTVSALGGGEDIEISSHVHGFFGELQNVNLEKVIDRPIRLEGDDYVFLLIRGLETIENSQGKVRQIFAKILLSDLPGSIIFDSFVSNPKTFDINLLRQLDKIELTILTRDGFEYEFFNNDFSFALEIAEYIDVLERSNLNSLSGRPDKTSFGRAV